MFKIIKICEKINRYLLHSMKMIEVAKKCEIQNETLGNVCDRLSIFNRDIGNIDEICQFQVKFQSFSIRGPFPFLSPILLIFLRKYQSYRKKNSNIDHNRVIHCYCCFYEFNLRRFPVKSRLVSKISKYFKFLSSYKYICALFLYQYVVPLLIFMDNSTQSLFNLGDSRGFCRKGFFKSELDWCST